VTKMTTSSRSQASYEEAKALALPGKKVSARRKPADAADPADPVGQQGMFHV
jgi:hypothetical protein